MYKNSTLLSPYASLPYLPWPYYSYPSAHISPIKFYCPCLQNISNFATCYILLPSQHSPSLIYLKRLLPHGTLSTCPPWSP